MTLINRIMIAFGLIFLLVVLTTSYSYVQMQQIEDTDQRNVHTFEVMQLAKLATEALVNIETGQRGYLLTADSEFLQPYHKGKSDVSQYLQSLLSKTADNPAQTARLKQIDQLYQQWLAEAVEPSVRKVQSSSADAAQFAEIRAMVSSGQGKSMMDKIRALIAELLAEEQQLLTKRQGAAADARQSALLSLFFSAVLIAVVGIAAALTLRQKLQQRLSLAQQQLNAVASGNLQLELPDPDHDEISLLLKTVNQMRVALHSLISQIGQASGEVSQASHSVASTSEQLAMSANEQSRASGSIAAAVEELSVSIDSVSANAREAHQLASESGKQAEQSAAVIGESVDSMQQIAQLVRAASSQITALGAQSEQISSIVNVIKGIADQTNLLALNAAIETARAGEQGRGFAVVADEVRMLAQRTTQSTTEISGMIDSIVRGTVEAVSQMSKGVEQVDQGVIYAGKAGTAIEQIQQNFRAVVQVIESISNALLEQNAASNEVAGHIEHIALMTAQNSEATQHSSAVAQQMKKLAADLSQHLSRFRL